MEVDAEKFNATLEALENQIAIEHIMSLDANPAMQLLDMLLADKVRELTDFRDDPRQPTEFRLDCIGQIRGINLYKEKLSLIKNRVEQMWREKELEEERKRESGRNPLLDALMR